MKAPSCRVSWIQIAVVGMRAWDPTELNRRATVGSGRGLVFLGTLSDGEKGRAMEEEGGWFRPWRTQIARPSITVTVSR